MKRPQHFVLYLTTFCLLEPLHAEAPFQLEPAAVKNLELKFANVEPRNIETGIRATGVVRLNETRVTEVVPRIDGLISEISVALGDKVDKGDPLFALQSGKLSQDLTNYVEAEQTMALAISALSQERKLEEKKLSSEEQVREKDLAMKQAMAAHARALQPLRLLDFDEGSLHSFLTKVDSSDFTHLDVKAPAAGEVIQQVARHGTAVDPDETLVTIADLSELWVDFQVSLREVGRLSIGMSVGVNSSVSDQKRSASISYIAPIADEASRTVLVRAILENKDQAWRPGTPVLVTVSGNAEAKTLSVPSSAVVDFHGGKAVFVKTDETTFVPTMVEIGANDGISAEVISGVTKGQMVVRRNAAQLKGHLEMTAGE